MKYNIHQDISKAETLDSSFYLEKEAYQLSMDKIFRCSFQYLADRQSILKSPENAFPVLLMEKALDEELILIKNDNKIRCYSNICTHRGFKILHHPAKIKKLQCGYHGRRFDLEGQFEFMPEFKEAEDFPRPCDNLPELELFLWKRFLFTMPSIESADFKLFETIRKQLDSRLGFLDMENWDFAPEFSKTYGIKANWALYCDNYLEGFHIPFVHTDLGKIVDYGQYTTEVHDHLVLQIGYGSSGEYSFNLPENHPDQGKFVTAYYYWVFPNFMLNVYTWGVQINVVKPIATDYCKVEFLYYIKDWDLWEKFGKDELAEKVEREDEFVVESVQKGLKSQFYKKGRFSPKREKGVHYFHRLIAQYMNSKKAD